MKRSLVFLLLAGGALVACHDDAKPEPTTSTSASVAATPTVTSTAIPTTTTATTSTTATTPTASTTTTSISTSISTSTTTSTTTSTSTSTSMPSAVAPTPPGKPVSAHFAAAAFTVDASNPGTCKVGGDCAVTLRYQTTGEYHVNDDYPYRFTANDAPGVQFQGSDGGGTFSKKTGDFQKASATSAVMNVRFRAANAGTATISGTFKVAFCTDTTCTPAVQAVSLAVPIH